MAQLLENRRARFDYEILESFEAGIELLGFEVKSLRAHKGSLEGAYIVIEKGQAFVLNMFISSYQENNTPKEYDPRRLRRLLLSGKEIEKLASIKGLTIVPISVYIKNNRIKVSVSLVRGKKKFDKRESIKRRETDREMEREMKER